MGSICSILKANRNFIYCVCLIHADLKHRIITALVNHITFAIHTLESEQIHFFSHARISQSLDLYLKELVRLDSLPSKG